MNTTIKNRKYKNNSYSQLKKTSAITAIYCIFNVDIYVKLNLIVIKKNAIQQIKKSAVKKQQNRKNTLNWRKNEKIKHDENYRNIQNNKLTIIIKKIIRIKIKKYNNTQKRNQTANDRLNYN